MIENNIKRNILNKTEFCLTEREIEILKLITEGKTNIEIAKNMNISIHTVKAHITNILIKMDVKYRIQAAVKAISENIINIWLQIKAYVVKLIYTTF